MELKASAEHCPVIEYLPISSSITCNPTSHYFSETLKITASTHTPYCPANAV